MSCNVEEQIKVRTEYRMSGVNYKKSNEIEQLLSKFEREVARFLTIEIPKEDKFELRIKFLWRCRGSNPRPLV